MFILELKICSKTIKDTKKIAKLIIKNFSKLKVICLTGDLGAGKTTFSKCLFKLLGVKDIVSSPTFTIFKEYLGKKKRIVHMDLYRLVDEEELREIGFEESLVNSDYVVIEWPEIAKAYLPKNYLDINISFDESGNRIFNIKEIYE